jgi:hypothetical protein
MYGTFFLIILLFDIDRVITARTNELNSVKTSKILTRIEYSGNIYEDNIQIANVQNTGNDGSYDYHDRGIIFFLKLHKLLLEN